MAIQARHYSGARVQATQVSSAPRLSASSHLRERLWNLLPLSISLGLVSTLFWAPYFAPTALAVGVVAFFVYWLIRSYSVVVACLIGLHRIRSAERANWRAKYASWLVANPGPNWEWPRHMVIIPNYKETEEGLSRTLDALAAQANAGQVVIVLAMEAREQGARAKAARLLMRYRTSFADMFATYHPAGLPGETPGKGSNEAWAAREAHIRLIENGGEDIDRYTVTSCDADAVFHPRHFEALNYEFLTAPDAYRTFWQPTIFNSNNIWDIPAPLRIPDGLSGINRLSNLVLPGSVKFPTSCYSLSWRMLHEVDYWDEEVIPEDWHVFLKCSFTLGDRVNVRSLYLPLGNDCVLADGYWKTLKAHYTQSVRHAWGASDIPYAWRASLTHDTPLSKRRRFVLTGAVTKVHALWMSQWYIITLGNLIPIVATERLAGRMPGWWMGNFPVRLPGPTWHLSQMLHGDFSSPMGGMINVNLAGALIYFCIFPLIAMIIIEFKTRGPRPAYVSRAAMIGQFFVWPLMAVITFFFASLPALHAQWKLASGKGLVYHVAEKGRHHAAAHLPALPIPAVAEVGSDPLGAVGGGS